MNFRVYFVEGLWTELEYYQLITYLLRGLELVPNPKSAHEFGPGVIERVHELLVRAFIMERQHQLGLGSTLSAFILKTWNFGRNHVVDVDYGKSSKNVISRYSDV